MSRVAPVHRRRLRAERACYVEHDSGPWTRLHPRRGHDRGRDRRRARRAWRSSAFATTSSRRRRLKRSRPSASSPASRSPSTSASATSSQILSATGVASANTHLLCTSATPVPLLFAVRGGRSTSQTMRRASTSTRARRSRGGSASASRSASPSTSSTRTRLAGATSARACLAPPSPDGEGFEVGAVGDLKGDGQRYTIARTGEVRNGEIVTSTAIYTNIDSD